jgi:chromosome segregation ATPase
VARRYIGRYRASEGTDESKRAELGAKIDIKDAIDVHDRSISFTKEQMPLTPTEATQVMAKELVDTIQDTSHYIHDVKTHMDMQMSTINKIKTQKEEFDREIDLLRFGNQQLKTKNSSIDEMKKIRDDLVARKKLEETNLARLSNHVMATKSQVDQYQNLIDEVDSKLKENTSQTPKLTDADKQRIAKILSSTMGKKYDDVELARTINQFAASLEESVNP